MGRVFGTEITAKRNGKLMNVTAADKGSNKKLFVKTSKTDDQMCKNYLFRQEFPFIRHAVGIWTFSSFSLYSHVLSQRLQWWLVRGSLWWRFKHLISRKCCPNTHGGQRINHNNFGDFQTFQIYHHREVYTFVIEHHQVKGQIFWFDKIPAIPKTTPSDSAVLLLMLSISSKHHRG